MRCPYCYNKEVVFGEGKFSNEEVLTFLKSRQNRLDGVVLSGGECTLNPYIVNLCEEIKELEFDIKIDTNGTNPEIVKELIELNLVDYIALDYKAPSNKFQEVTKSNLKENFYKTLNLLIEKNFAFEARTTLHTDILDEKDINTIIKDLKDRNYNHTYYIQNYLHVEDTIGELNPPQKSLNPKLLSDSLKIEFRTN